VIALGEFGRTPQVNKDAGRDHWSNAMSVLFAGGGTPGGQVIGATDRKGYAAIERVLSPENFAATVYAKLGIDPNKILFTPQGRRKRRGGGEGEAQSHGCRRRRARHLLAAPVRRTRGERSAAVSGRHVAGNH